MGSDWRQSNSGQPQTPQRGGDKVQFDTCGRSLRSADSKQHQPKNQTAAGQWNSSQQDGKVEVKSCWGGKRKSREPKSAQAPAVQNTKPVEAAPRAGRERTCSAILRSSIQIHAEADESVHMSPASRASSNSPKCTPPIKRRVSGFFEGLLDTMASGRGLFDSMATTDIFSSSADCRAGVLDSVLDTSVEGHDGVLDSRMDCPRPLMETASILEKLQDDEDDCSGEEADTFHIPDWKIDPHDIYFFSKESDKTKCSKLGRGDFGPVYHGVWREMPVAVKLARQKPISWRAERDLQKQVTLMHGLRHPNVVEFYGACCWQGGKRTVLVTEFMAKGSLRAALKRASAAGRTSFPNSVAVASEVALGLAFLHSKGITHTRLRSSNVLLSKDGVAKISDANLSKVLAHCKGWDGSSSAAMSSGKSSGDSGSNFAWMAPEVLLGGKPDSAADIYSFGVLLWEMLTLQSASHRTLRSLRVPGEATATMADVQAWCCNREPSRRPTAQQLIRILAKV